MTASEPVLSLAINPETVEKRIAGEYQFDALLRGRAFQRAWHRARLDLVKQLLPPAADRLVLDAAAGSGTLTWRFEQPTIISADLRVTACQAVRGHTPAARAAAADLGALPFRSSTFTRIYLLEAIEHLSEEKATQTLQELRRVAAPGARCLMTTPNYRSHWVVLEWVIDRLGLTPPMADAQHVTRYASDSFRRKAESCGWTIEQAGSFNLVAPFVGMLSRAAASSVVRLEARHARNAGALLYIVCRTSQ
jgi:ubiquinone/menaquinone biosynthesis C-methylase UbiE